MSLINFQLKQQGLDLLNEKLNFYRQKLRQDSSSIITSSIISNLETSINFLVSSDASSSYSLLSFPVDYQLNPGCEANLHLSLALKVVGPDKPLIDRQEATKMNDFLSNLINNKISATLEPTLVPNVFFVHLPDDDNFRLLRVNKLSS